MVLPAVIPGAMGAMSAASAAAGAGSFLSSMGGVGSMLSGIGSIGGLFGGGGLSPRKAAALQHHYWQEQVRNELPLRVAGAHEAGLHPLAALGVSSSVGGVSVPVGQDNRRQALREFGQDISRAEQAYSSKGDRLKKEMADRLALEKASLENDLLRSQITTVNRSTTPGINRGAVSSEYLVNPSEITSYRPDQPGEVGGPAQPAAVEIRNRDGSTSIVPSKDIAESLEAGGEIMGGIMALDWFTRNRILPFMKRNMVRGHRPKPARQYPSIY